MKRYHRLLSLVLSFSLFLTVFSFTAQASENSIDDFLLSKGVSQEIINILPDGQKLLIYETLEDTATFASFDAQIVTLENENSLNNTEGSESAGGIEAMSGMIPTSSLTFTVVAFDLTVNGQPQTAIYPSFIWSDPQYMNNDSFSMALYPGWDVVPGKCNLRLYKKYIGSQSTHLEYDFQPILSTSNGYSYKIPSNHESTWFVPYVNEGHSGFNAIKTNPNATRAISLNYVQDTSSFFYASYTVSILGLSIGVSGSTSSLNYMSGNFGF